MDRLKSWALERIELLRTGRYPAEPIALFRIFGALVLLLDVSATWQFSSLFWGTWHDVGVLDAAYGAWSIVIILLLLGYRTTLMAVLNFLFTFPMLLELPMEFEYHIDYFARAWSLYIIFLQSGRAYSIDSAIRQWRHRMHGAPKPLRTVPLWIVLLFVFQFSLDYFDAGLRKVTDPVMWGQGFGLYWPIVARWSSTGYGEWLADYEFLIKGMSYGSMWLEVMFPVLLLWRPTRYAAVIGGVVLHIGIVYTLPISYFGEFMLALYFVFLPKSWIDRITGAVMKRTRRRSVAFDPTCTTCASRAYLLDVLHPGVDVEKAEEPHLGGYFAGRHHESGVRPEPVTAPDERSYQKNGRVVGFFAIVTLLLVIKAGHFDLLPTSLMRVTDQIGLRVSSFVRHPVFMPFHFDDPGMPIIDIEYPDGRLERYPLLTEDGYPDTFVSASTRNWVYMVRFGMLDDPRPLLPLIVPWFDVQHPDACAMRVSRKMTKTPREWVGRIDTWTNAPVQKLVRIPFRRPRDLCPAAAN